MTQSPDTHARIEKIQIALIRQESFAKKTAQLCSLSQTTRQLSKRAIKRANPTLTHHELERLFVRYLYGADLANRLRHQVINKISMKQADIIAAVKPVAKAFEELGIRYYIGGSVASSVYGMPRATQDVDLVTDFKPQHIRPLVERLQSDYYIDEDMISDAINRSACFNLLHFDTLIKIDVFVVKDGPYQRTVFQRKREETLDEEERALTFFVASCEDIILSKLDMYRVGGLVSDQQWRDILGILKVQTESLDRKYLLTWAAELGLNELLTKAFQDADF